VHSAAEFRRVFRKGLRLDGALFLMLAAENGRDAGRLGLAVGRRVGGAVERNKAKRLLRESFRRNKIEAVRGLDLVLVPKREIVGRTFADVEREYRARLKRLAQRRHGSTPARPH
jgi:ribonuclease P protein component